MAGRPYLIVYRPQQSFQKQQENYVSKQTIDQNHLEHFSADFGAKQLFHVILCEIWAMRMITRKLMDMVTQWQPGSIFEVVEVTRTQMSKLSSQ